MEVDVKLTKMEYVPLEVSVRNENQRLVVLWSGTFFVDKTTTSTINIQCSRIITNYSRQYGRLYYLTDTVLSI